MKKVFISMPMKGRTKENIDDSIRRMKNVITAILDEEVEFINTIVEEEPPYLKDKDHTSVWYLGKSIQILSQADYLATPKVSSCLCTYTGCFIEHQVAELYGIKIIDVPYEFICPDIWEEVKMKSQAYKCDCDSLGVCEPLTPKQEKEAEVFDEANKLSDEELDDIFDYADFIKDVNLDGVR